MARANQEPKSFRKVIKRKMLDHGPRGLTVRKLALDVGHDEAVVSKAINHGRYPLVLRKVKEALGV